MNQNKGTKEVLTYFTDDPAPQKKKTSLGEDTR